jgi:Fe-S cluster assembly protein SufD
MAGGRSGVTSVLAAELESLKQRAAQRFAVLGYPTTRNEDWKFTSVAAIAQGTWLPPSVDSAEGVRPASLEPFRLGLPVHELVFINGRYAPHLSRTGDLPQGVTVASLAQVIDSSPELVEPWLGSVADFGAHAFTALNTSQIADGAFVTVPGGVRIADPVHLLFLSNAEGQRAAHPRNLIVAGESSEITIVETYAGLRDSAYFTNAVTEIAVGANARVEHLKLQRESEQAFHVGTIEVRQERDSRFRSFSFSLGGSLVRTNIYSVMAGEGSDCAMNGLYLLHHNQHIDHQTRIEHAFPNCTSREVYKGILDGSSHGVFNGKVFVRPEAQKTDGKQTNKNLLLSDGAKVDTKPQLEIFADDVKCTHGATVGRLDEIGLFYLESRGISAARARRLLTYGFAAEVLGEIGQDPIRHQLERLVFERLETSLQGG